MANNNEPKFEDTEPLFEETEAIEESSPAQQENSESFLQSLMTNPGSMGAQQGVTLGFADELQGGIQSALNKAYQAMGKESPTDVNAKLAAQGFTGDVGPTSTMDLYRDTRDTARQDYAKAKKQDPSMYHLGEFSGGFLAPIPGAKALTGATKVAKEAPLLARMAAGAKAGAKVGTLAGAQFGAGSSEADLTQPSISTGGEFAQDVALGAGSGAVIGPVAGAAMVPASDAFEGAKSLIGKIVPENIKIPFKRGMEGADIYNADSYTNQQKKLEAQANELAEPILSANKEITAKNETAQLGEKERLLELQNKLEAKKTEIKAQAKKEADVLKEEKAQLAEQLKQKKTALKEELKVSNDKAKSQMDNIKSDFEKSIDLDKQRQIETNQQKVSDLNKKSVETAKRLQERLGKVKDTVGKEFEKIEAASESVAAQPKNQDVVASFQEQLLNNSGLPESDVASIMKRVNAGAGKEENYQTFKTLKKTLHNYFEHANPVVRRAAKMAYGQLNENYANALVESGEQELANQMKQTNKKWGTLMTLEDNFIGSYKPDRLTNEMVAQPETLRTMSAYHENTPEQLAKKEQFQQYLNVAAPNEAPAINQEIGDLSKQVMAAKEFKPVVPHVDEALATNSQYQDLSKQLAESTAAKDTPETKAIKQKMLDVQNRLKQSKNMTPDERLASDPETSIIEDQMRSPFELPKLDEPIPEFSKDPVALKKQIMKLLPKFQRESGDVVSEDNLNQLMKFLEKEKGPEFVAELKPKLKTMAQDIYAQGQKEKGSILGVPLRTSYVAGQAGKGVRNVKKILTEPILNKPKKFASSGSQMMSDMGDEQLTNLAEQGAKIYGEKFKSYGKALESVKGKSSVSKNAVIFSLMQKPDFREMARKIMNKEQKDGQ